MEQARKNAEKVYRALGLSCTARVDAFLSDGRFLVNEVTPIPGLSSEAVYILQWEHYGFSKREIFSRLADTALERNSTKKQYLVD